jgi:hypothetical protein
MSDEKISIALTDDGTIEQITGLLEVFGVNVEAAANRAVGSFNNVAKSQDAAAASAKILAEAEKAGVQALDTVALTLDKLTNSELKAAASSDQLAATVQRLVVAENESIAAAVNMARGVTDAGAALEGAGNAATTAAARFGTVARATQDISAVTAGLNISQKETVAILTSLGVSAADAGAKMEAGYTSGASAAQRLATSQAALSQAAKAGYLDLEAVENAIGALTQAELVAISNTEGMAQIFRVLSEAVETSNSAFAANAVAVEAETGTFTAAANRADALAAAHQRLRDFMAADAATAAELAAAMTGVAAAETEAGTAAVSAGEKFLAVKEAGAGIAATFGGLNAIFAGAFATHEIIEASDEFAKINGTLVAVTGSSKAAAAAYSAIRQVANDTQTPLEANINTFGQLSAATSHAGLSASQLVDALKGIDAGLKVAGTSGQPATAALRSLAEVYETTGSATRYFQNLQRESPFLFQAIKKAADESGISLEEFGSKSGDVSQRQRDLSTILARVGTDLQGQVGAVNTVGGALTVLKNNLVDYVGSSTTASAETTILKDVIYAVATNLNIAIPAVLGLAAAVTVVKVAQLAVDLVNVATATVGWIASLSPTVLIVAAVTAGLIGLTLAIQAIYNYFHQSEPIDIFGAALSKAKDYAGQFGTALGGLSTALQKHAQNTSAAGTVTENFATSTNTATASQAPFINALQGVAGAHGAASSAADTHLKTISVLDANTKAATTSTAAHTQATKDYATATYTANDGTQTVLKSVSVLTTNVHDATKAVNDNKSAFSDQVAAAKASADATASAGVAATNSTTGWQSLSASIKDTIANLLNYKQAAAEAATQTPVASSQGIGHAREGGTFHVPGGTGVDSRLIAVSPGEVVTVQTPAQYAAGVAPAKRPGQTHFADGGVIAPAGVDLGGRAVNLGVGTPSVQGFSESRQGPTAATTTVTQLAPALSASAAATSANTAAVTASTASTANDTTTTANLSGAVDNLTSTLSTTNAALDHVAETVTALEGRIAATNFGAAAASAPAAANNNTPTPTAPQTTYTPPPSTPSTPATTSTPALTGAAAVAAALAQQPVGIIGASRVTLGSNTSTSSSGSTSIGSAASASAQLKSQLNTSATLAQQILQGFTKVGQGYVNYATGQTQTEQEHAKQVQAAAALQTQAQLFARDGGDFHVAGGTGVDSKVVQLAVSPGETVGVRTPAQRAAAGGGGDNHQTVNMYVSTPDAGSFKQSSGQLSQKLVRGLRRAGRG